jgi:PBSX family phage terminase large subunit
MATAPAQPARPHYTPYGAVAELWRCRDAEVLIPGAAGTGKSRGVLEKVHLYLLKYPKARGLIVRKTRASMTESVLVTFETHVAVAGCNITNQQRRTRTAYDYTNGSSLVVGGLDNPDRLMSTEYDIIAVFEATELTEDDWEKLTTRLRNGKGPYQQIIGDCNPSAPSHWLKRRADRGQVTTFPSTHKDNPMLWDGSKWTKRGEAYLATLGSLTGHRRARLLDGKWAAAEGLVYPEFDASTHVITTRVISDSWRRIVSIDFGYVHPFVAQWWAIDEDGRMYLYRELYRSQRIVADHAKQILELSKGERIDAFISDHDAEDRATLAAAGIQTIAADKDHRTGRDAVHARLRVQDDGRPRLFIMADCTVETDAVLYGKKRPTSTLAEFDSYIYPPGKDGKADKEEPVKECDDGMDAMRYAVMYLDSPNRSHGAWASVATQSNQRIASTNNAGTMMDAERPAPVIERTWF